MADNGTTGQDNMAMAAAPEEALTDIVDAEIAEEDLGLGEASFSPTSPAPRFVDPFESTDAVMGGFTPAPVYTPPAYENPAPPITQPVAPAPTASYTPYEPQANYSQMPQYPVVPAYTPMAVSRTLPGQMIQTPYGNLPVSDKSKVTAGVLGILLGSLGVGRFYRGFVGLGIAQIIVTFCTFGFGFLWGFIDGIMVLVSQPGSHESLDSDGRVMM
jgi:hypothetical protein